MMEKSAKVIRNGLSRLQSSSNMENFKLEATEVAKRLTQ